MNLHQSRGVLGSVENPEKLVTVQQLRTSFDIFGREHFVVTLVKVEGGFEFKSHPRSPRGVKTVIRSEKARRRRVFKTVEAALNLAASLGFAEVRVEL